MTNSKSSLWNFITISPKSNKSYAVFCTGDISKSNNLIKVALKKLPKDHRLIVVTHNPSEEDFKHAEEREYGLIAFDDLNNISEQMVGIKNLDLDSITKHKKQTESEPATDFVDKVISKERLF